MSKMKKRREILKQKKKKGIGLPGLSDLVENLKRKGETCFGFMPVSALVRAKSWLCLYLKLLLAFKSYNFSKIINISGYILYFLIQVHFAKFD